MRLPGESVKNLPLFISEGMLSASRSRWLSPEMIFAGLGIITVPSKNQTTS
jgi:hypothetical protein